MDVLIGISANYNTPQAMLNEHYYCSVIASGGTPVIIPPTTDISVLENIVQRLDGIIFSGGYDVNPRYYNEELIPENGEVNDHRDSYELALMSLAVKYQLPILGICRGMQLINIAFGGTLYQDLKAQYPTLSLEHSQELEKNITTQNATILSNTKLKKILSEDIIAINSVHHQAVKDVANNFIVSALADDGVVEAIESLYYPIIGVQWHPEYLSSSGVSIKELEIKQEGNVNIELFRWLVEESRIFCRAKKIHQKSYVIDSHCDTPMFFDYNNVNIFKNEKFLAHKTEFDASDTNNSWYEIKVDAEKMKCGRVDAVFMVAYIPQKSLDLTYIQEAEQQAESIFNKIIFQQKSYNNEVVLVYDYHSLILAKEKNKPAIFLALENGYALGNSLDNIDKFYKLGVRYITLCHNGDNQIGDSAMRTNNTHNGLSDFGRRVIEKMNQLGIMIDISHAGEKTFWDVIEISRKPIIASHSCCMELCNHLRNLTDKQIEAIAKSGGVVQICLYRHFLSTSQKATIDDVIRHIKHVIEVVGVDFVGIGSDFDGGGEIMGCEAENEVINITKALIKEGFSDENISKIMGGNLLRVIKNI